ncbi:MAG: hypothetical protein QOE00_2766 [Ilumatobacteraceae bacterium]
MQVSPFLDGPLTDRSYLRLIIRCMNTTKKFLISVSGAAFAGILTIGATASAAGPVGGTDTVRTDRAEYICTHQTEIADRLSKAETGINERIATLTARRAEAEQAGHTKIVARIDKRLERLHTMLDRATNRATQLPTWVAAHCNAAS